MTKVISSPSMFLVATLFNVKHRVLKRSVASCSVSLLIFYLSNLHILPTVIVLTRIINKRHFVLYCYCIDVTVRLVFALYYCVEVTIRLVLCYCVEMTIRLVLIAFIGIWKNLPRVIFE